MTNQSHLQGRVNYYICIRLKADETGLIELEDLIPNKLYEEYYTTVSVESDKLSVDRQLPLRFDWSKARKDYQEVVNGFVDELQVTDTANWLCVVGLVGITKTFMRHYKVKHPLFAAMFSLELLHNLNKIPNSSFCTWRKKMHQDSKQKTPPPTEIKIYKKNRLIDGGIITGLAVCVSYFWWRLLV